MKLSERISEIEALPRELSARAFFDLCMAKGIGLGVTDRLVLRANGKLTQRLADALSEHAAAIALLLPGSIGITTAELEIEGPIVAEDQELQ